MLTWMLPFPDRKLLRYLGLYEDREYVDKWREQINE